MEICNLSYAEFKMLVIMILKKITGYCRSIIKTQVMEPQTDECA